MAILKDESRIVTADPATLLDGDQCWLTFDDGRRVEYYARTITGLHHWRTRFYRKDAPCLVQEEDREIRILPATVVMFLPDDVLSREALFHYTQEGLCTSNHTSGTPCPASNS